MSAIQPMLRPIATIGFIGLGVMGEPMCGHLARRSGRTVLAHDLRPEPLARLAEFGVAAASPAQIAERCDLILLSLPDGKAVQAVIGALEPLLGRGAMRGGYQHLAGDADARDRGAAGGAWHRVRRRAGGAHAGSGGARRAFHHGRGARTRCSRTSAECWRPWAAT